MGNQIIWEQSICIANIIDNTYALFFCQNRFKPLNAPIFLKDLHCKDYIIIKIYVMEPLGLPTEQSLKPNKLRKRSIKYEIEKRSNDAYRQSAP